MLTDQQIGYMRRLNAGRLLGPQFHGEVDEALAELQQKRKVVKIHVSDSLLTLKISTWWQCPVCEETEIEASYKYCPHCGLKLQWISE